MLQVRYPQNGPVFPKPYTHNQAPVMQVLVKALAAGAEEPFCSLRAETLGFRLQDLGLGLKVHVLWCGLRKRLQA